MDPRAPDDQHEHGAFVDSVKHALRECGGWSSAVDIAGMDGMKANVSDVEEVLSDLAARGAVGHRVVSTHQYRAAGPERETRPVGFATRLRMVYEALAGGCGYATPKQLERSTGLPLLEVRHAIHELRRAGITSNNAHGNVRSVELSRENLTDLILLEVVEGLTGETPLRALARKVGLSEEETRTAVDRLFDRGLIECRPTFGDPLGQNPHVFVGGHSAIDEYDAAFEDESPPADEGEIHGARNEAYDPDYYDALQAFSVGGWTVGGGAVTREELADMIRERLSQEKGRWHSSGLASALGVANGAVASVLRMNLSYDPEILVEDYQEIGPYAEYTGSLHHGVRGISSAKIPSAWVAR